MKLHPNAPTALALALALLASGASQALTVVTQFGLPLGKGFPAQSGQLSYFDASLGTLTGASLTVFAASELAFSVFLDGTGTFSLRSTWTQDSLANVGNGVTFSTSGANYGFGAILTYTYSALPAVPEPGAWVLMTLGMATLVTLRRHRHRRGPNATTA